MDEFKLPGSSYLELIKLIRAYGSKKAGVPCSLDEISKICAMDKTQISRNNGFFISMNLVSKGKNKAPTEMCIKLAKAYSLNIDEKIAECWREIISTNEFVMSMINVISIKTSMDKVEFINHIIYSSGNSNSNNTRAGASALIDIIKNSGYLVEDNDKIYMGSFMNQDVSLKESDAIDEPINLVEKNENDSVQIKSFDIDKNKAFIQEYLCSNGEKARIIIPFDANEDDLLSLYDMFRVILRRKYKITNDKLEYFKWF